MSLREIALRFVDRARENKTESDSRMASRTDRLFAQSEKKYF